MDSDGSRSPAMAAVAAMALPRHSEARRGPRPVRRSVLANR
jgi:hypothetical protein